MSLSGAKKQEPLQDILKRAKENFEEKMLGATNSVTSSSHIADYLTRLPDHSPRRERLPILRLLRRNESFSEQQSRIDSRPKRKRTNLNTDSIKPGSKMI